MENTSDYFMPRPLLFCMKSEKSVCYSVPDNNTLNDAWKKMEIIDRINAQLGWMAFDDQTGIEPCFYVLDTCSTYIHEMETYSWKEDKDNTPEDGHDHMVNSVQYAWIPYQGKIYKR